MALWPKQANAYIRAGWGYWRGFVFERATDNMPCTIDVEDRGYVFVILKNGTRVRVDKRGVQVLS